MFDLVVVNEGWDMKLEGIRNDVGNQNGRYLACGNVMKCMSNRV